jgi:hypothetical protein
MTVFKRTYSGLSNLYLFERVDAVVFVEGGESYGRKDVESGRYNVNSIDITFWRALFGVFYPAMKLSFRAVGSKTTVNGIAVDIRDGKILRVIAAMDRDFDDINGGLVISNNVLYTYGYSWENDCWRLGVILKVLCVLSGRNEAGIICESVVIKKIYDEFICKMMRMVRVDAILSQYGDGLFDREHPLRYMKKSSSGRPDINTPELINSLRTARRKNSRPVIERCVIKIDVLRDCFGHICGEYGFMVLKYLLKKMNEDGGMAKEFANRVTIEKFSILVQNGELHEISDYYKSEFTKVLL